MIGELVAKKAQEGQIIGQPDHDWDVISPMRWKCRRCEVTVVCESGYPTHDPLYATSTVEHLMLLNSHDRTCPCACYHCTGDYEKMVMEVQSTLDTKLVYQSGSRFIEGFMGMTTAIDRWEETHRPERFAREMELRKLRVAKDPVLQKLNQAAKAP